MSRVFTCGFEAGSLSPYFSVLSGSPLITSGTANLVRTGNYAAVMNNPGEYVRTPSLGANASLYGGFAYMCDAWPAAAGYLMRTIDAAGNVLSAIRMHPGGVLGASRQTTTLSTGTIVISLDSYVYVEWYILINNTSGRIVTKINGVTDIDFTGDTQPSTDNDIVFVDFFQPATSVLVYFDDIVINNTSGTVNNSYPGSIRLLPDYPNNSGSATQLLRGGTDTGQNYSQVNEVPYNASQYVYSNGLDSYDLYNIQNPSLPANAEIQNIIINAIAKVDSGTGNLALMTKSGSTESQGVDKSLGITDKCIQEVWNIDPSTSGTWSASAVNNLEVGVKIR